jgi:hypothetical protein
MTKKPKHRELDKGIIHAVTTQNEYEVNAFTSKKLKRTIKEIFNGRSKG